MRSGTITFPLVSGPNTKARAKLAAATQVPIIIGVTP
jgi:hypothetical protein